MILSNPKFERAFALLNAHRSALEALSERLLTQETVDGSAVRQALAPAPAAAGSVASIAARALH
jgi:ATP-dependent Zn protease